MEQGDEQGLLDEATKVALFHKKRLDKIDRQTQQDKDTLNECISGTEEVLKSIGVKLPESHFTSRKPDKSETRIKLPVREWSDILREAEESYLGGDCFDLLSPAEIKVVLERHEAIGADLNWFNSLDRYDCALSVAAGVIAGLADIFLVKIPHLPAGASGEWMTKQGGLSGFVNEKFGNILPPEKIKMLEEAYEVPYDPSSSSGLASPVAGLYPRTHRLQSLGHDPILGFFFGIRDILRGEFSAIGTDGVLVIQQTAKPYMAGESLFIRLFEAVKLQAGHLASDVGTSQGLPPPLFPLLQFCQFGKIGPKDRTVAEMTRYMYTTGYDFRHFVSSSLPVMLIEVIVRVGYFVRALYQGKSLSESIPVASSLKLRRQLLIAHGTAMMINAGKVTITKNIWGISLPQVLALSKYLIPELMFLIDGKERTRQKMVQSEIISTYDSINADLDRIMPAFSVPQIIL